MDRKRLLKRDYKALEFQAAVLYIKEGLSAKVICERLNLSMPTVQKWNKQGQWDKLRPNLEILTQYRAAALYIEKGFTTGQIAQQLSTSEKQIEIWIYMYGWDAARQIAQAQNIIVELTAAFCAHYKKLFPDDAAQIEVVQNDFIKKVTAKI